MTRAQRTQIKARKNGPTITYKFIDDEHKRLYDTGKLPFELATYRVEPEPFLEMVTQSQVRDLKKSHPNYLYPNQIKTFAKVFLFVDETTGEVGAYNYLYTDALITLASARHGTLYVTNKV